MLCFFCKQKSAYEMRISDWSLDVCSSDLRLVQPRHRHVVAELAQPEGRDSAAQAKVVEQHQARRAHADPLVGRLHELPGERRPEGRSAERRLRKESLSTFQSRCITYY